MMPASDSPSGEIPKSDALSEAGSGAESIAELLSRDPETLSEADFDRQIEVMRQQRQRWLEAERQGLHKRKAATKVPLATSANEDSGDLGL